MERSAFAVQRTSKVDTVNQLRWLREERASHCVRAVVTVTVTIHVTIRMVEGRILSNTE